jgi:hypothetical protein
MLNPRTTNPLNFATPTQIEHSWAILQWLETYIASPHGELGREGPICPFVPPALTRDSIYVTFHYEATSETDIIDILCRYVPIFISYDPVDEPENIYKTLLIAFPSIPDHETTVLDRVHTCVKTEFVQNGLMLGQFHPHCPEPAVRNPFFRISISPIPLVAIRHMAVHDILFVTQNELWFREYADRFSWRYERKMVHSPLFIDLFNDAKVRFQI